MGKSLNDIKDIYKEIAEEDKKLSEDFMSISDVGEVKSLHIYEIFKKNE